ncbi:uncharacterized protein G2W53_005054 [Senna tora]|uniref:Uncharacterized protein n=1 Tax=Senna tora TaxID=362788 RepID=A0A835CH12_9FABA|nr:uncharacterized protein G2W53_005054 [Senna tora]
MEEGFQEEKVRNDEMKILRLEKWVVGVDSKAQYLIQGPPINASSNEAYCKTTEAHAVSIPFP